MYLMTNTNCKASETAMVSDAENARLDALNAYISTILNGLHGDDLDVALSSELKRRHRSDSEYRTAAMNGIHPDDLVGLLARKGFTLARLGIVSISI